MAMLAPALIGAGATLLGSILGKPKAKTSSLDKQVSQQYGQYMPQINEDLMGMANQEPSAQRGQFLDQAATIRRYADSQRGQSMRMLGQGGANSLGAGNMFAGIDLNTLRALMQNLQQYQQGQDTRKQGIYGQIAGNVGQNVGGAMSAQMQGQTNQANMMGSIGGGIGGLIQAYMQSQIKYPQAGGGGAPYQTQPINSNIQYA